VERYAIPAPVAEDYLSAYDGDRFVESMRYARAYPEQLPVLGELLPGIQVPVLNIAGGRDRAVPVANSEYLHQRLPHSTLDIIDTGHFHLGGRRRRVRGSGHRLVGRRLRRRLRDAGHAIAWRVGPAGQAPGRMTARPPTAPWRSRS
jgi:pimeloyl-ACP methyl ester carboxylesterase